MFCTICFNITWWTPMKSAQNREIKRKQERKRSSLLTTFMIMQCFFHNDTFCRITQPFVYLITLMFEAILTDSAHCSSRSYKNNILKIGSISIFSCTQYCCVTQAWGGSVCTLLIHFSTSPPNRFQILRELPSWHWWLEIARNLWEASRMTTPA
jgi:hypothetical protein